MLNRWTGSIASAKSTSAINNDIHIYRLALRYSKRCQIFKISKKPVVRRSAWYILHEFSGVRTVYRLNSWVHKILCRRAAGVEKMVGSKLYTSVLYYFTIDTILGGSHVGFPKVGRDRTRATRVVAAPMCSYATILWVHLPIPNGSPTGICKNIIITS